MTAGIRPGLIKTARLLTDVPSSWQAIHVAGTNGKGSTCAYIAAMLKAANIRVGRFSSPHLKLRWDGITIDEKTVQKSLFMQVESSVKEHDRRHYIGASSFELLTATAFKIFNQCEVDVGIVECGMGGRLDATNVLRKPLVSVITNVDLDHQDFLGNTISEIAAHKAGIIKAGARCVLSRQNTAEAIDVVTREAAKKNVKLEMAEDIGHASFRDYVETVELSSLSPVQRYNMGCALTVVKHILPDLSSIGSFKLGPLVDLASDEQRRHLAPMMLTAHVPGRYHSISIQKVAPRQAAVLMDGAHNVQGWQLLRNHVDKQLRRAGKDQNVTWLIAQSSGTRKDPALTTKVLCQKGDRIIGCEFSPVAGMPWVKSVTSDQFELTQDGGANLAGTFGKGQLREALLKAVEVAQEGPLVITGSLYLISDILRLLDPV